MTEKSKLMPNFNLEAVKTNSPNFDEFDHFKISKKDLKGKKVVLFFYPKDNTPGCTSEAKDFSKLKKEFEKLNVEVIGVSKDSIKSHEKFIKNHNLTVSLLSDEDVELAKSLGIWVEKSMFGKKYMGMERSSFVFTEDGKLVLEYRKVKVTGHAQKILSDIKEL